MINIRTYSLYSLKHSIASIEKIVEKAIEDGDKHIAILDKDDLYSLIYLQKACNEHNIQPIIGYEFNDFITLWPKNNDGLKEINKMLLLESKVRNRTLINQYKFQNVIAVTNSLSETSACELSVGKDNTYLEYEFGQKPNNPIYPRLIPSCKVLYNDQKDALGHDYFINYVWKDDRHETKDTFFIKQFKDVNLSDEEKQYIKDFAANFSIKVELNTLKMPKYDTKQTGQNSDPYSWLLKLCDDSLIKLANNNPIVKNRFSTYKDRLLIELKDIKETNLAPYFLIVKDICDWARANGIKKGKGRGSAAGSLVCFLTNITGIDPIEHHLIWERFYNIGRKGSLPDIDTDFEAERRNEVIEYIRERFGRDKVFNIITFGSMGPKKAIKAVLSVAGCSFEEQNQITALIWHKATTIDEALAHSDKLREEMNKRKAMLVIAKQIEGALESFGKHAAGIIISNESFYDGNIPMTWHPDDEEYISGMDLDAIEALGLLKIDILGLNTLNIIKDVEQMVTLKTNKQFNIDNIDYLDKDVYENIFHNGKTKCVFQLESQVGQKYSELAKPNNIDEIADVVTIIRPGSMVPKQTDKYLDVRNGADPAYPHKDLQEVLGDTYGACIWAEQEILTTRGLIKIKDIRVGDYVIGEDSKIGKVVRAQKTGVKNVNQIHLSNGKTVIATSDHKFLTKDGYRQINEGDLLTFSKNQVKYGTDNDSKAIVLAGLLSEGYIPSGSSYSFANMEHSIRKYFREHIELAFPDVDTYEFFNTRCWYIGLRRIKGNNRTHSVKQWFQKIGLENCDSYSKFIPNEVFSWSATTRAKFIGMYISGDGHSNHKNIVQIRTASTKIAYGLSTILDTLGIYNRIWKDTENNYTIFILDFDAYNNLIEPYVVGTKKGKIQAQSKLGPAPEQLIDIRVNSGLSCRAFSRKYNIDRRTEQYTTKMFIYEKIKGKQNNLYIKIDNIEPYLSNVDVWDIEVENIHSFNVGGVVAHNCIYQEQIIKLCVKFAGTELKKADSVRAAAGKKKKKLMESLKDEFINGCIKNNHTKELAELLWSWIVEFSGYSFNKSHAVSYAYAAYETAYLKYHFPIEFFIANLNRVVGDIHRSEFDKISEIVNDAKLYDITIRPPSVKIGNALFESPDTKTIVYGLDRIKGVGTSSIPIIRECGKATTYDEFIKIAFEKGLRKDVTEALISCGALDCYKVTRHQMLADFKLLDELTDREHAEITNNLGKPINIIIQNMIDENNIINRKLNGQIVPNVRRREKLKNILEEYQKKDKYESILHIARYEKEYLGCSLSANEADSMFANITHSCMEIKNLPAKTKVKTSIVLSKIKEIETKKGKHPGQKMAFLTGGDASYELNNIVIFPDPYKKFGALLKEGNVLFLDGITGDNGGLIVNRMVLLK